MDTQKQQYVTPIRLSAVTDKTGSISAEIVFSAETDPEKQLALVAKVVFAMHEERGIKTATLIEEPAVAPITADLEFVAWIEKDNSVKSWFSGAALESEKGALFRACVNAWLAKTPQFKMEDVIAATVGAGMERAQKITDNALGIPLTMIALATMSAPFGQRAPGVAGAIAFSACSQLPRKSRFFLGARLILDAIFRK